MGSSPLKVRTEAGAFMTPPSLQTVHKNGHMWLEKSSSHEPSMHPCGDGKQPVIHPKRPDHLYAHWQTMRPRMAGERHCRRVEQGPYAIEDWIACRFQTCWCLPWGAWH